MEMQTPEHRLVGPKVRGGEGGTDGENSMKACEVK